jgi:hypothetical protein
MTNVSPRSGSCLCKAVQFTATPEKLELDACHCGMCRRWTGGINLTVPCRDLRVADESALGCYKSSDFAERLFCRTCGSSMFWRMQNSDGHVAVSFQSFDDQSELTFAEEIFIDEKPDHYAFAGSRPRRTGAEVIAAFQAQQGDGPA